MNEPIKHHYIPQFILRQFCFGGKESLLFYDKNSNAISKKSTKDVFMTPDLYRDEINHADDPAKTERDFAKFEGEMAGIIKNRFLDKQDIVISQEENEALKFFLALMGFRSKNASEAFGEKASPTAKRFYARYGSLPDYWQRNLGYLVNCRSLHEVLAHPSIDPEIKVFMRRDVEGDFGRYLAVVECREPDEFVISDAYPTVITGMRPDGIPLEMYSIYPLSSKRAVLLSCIGVKSAPREVLKMRECIFSEPSLLDEQRIKIRVRKLYQEETGLINREVIKNARTGVAFRTENAKKYFAET